MPIYGYVVTHVAILHVWVDNGYHACREILVGETLVSHLINSKS